MGIITKPATCSKPPEDYPGVASGDPDTGRTTHSNNLSSSSSSSHAMINPLSEDAAEVRQNLLNDSARRVHQLHQQQKSKDKTRSASTTTTRSGRCGLGSWLAHKSGGTSDHWGQVTVVNLVFYMLCVAAIGCSVYLNYRQSFLEERLRYMRHLDERLTGVESRLETLYLQTEPQTLQKSSSSSHHRRRVSPAINGFFSTTEREEFRASSSLALSAAASTVEDDEEEDDSSSEEVEDVVGGGGGGGDSSVEYEDMKSVVRKLSLQVEGIQRLRRDVSHLKLTRQQRQTAIEQSPEDMCSCPPGKCNYHLGRFSRQY